mmetsp:Transcript_38623/g.74949  ORF Transcript_38623/g.74949 Transcript_38623/m.74949 type:complete len:1199 (-) Transcript_38623:84-3680(-)
MADDDWGDFDNFDDPKATTTNDTGDWGNFEHEAKDSAGNAANDESEWAAFDDHPRSSAKPASTAAQTTPTQAAPESDPPKLSNKEVATGQTTDEDWGGFHEEPTQNSEPNTTAKVAESKGDGSVVTGGGAVNSLNEAKSSPPVRPATQDTEDDWGKEFGDAPAPVGTGAADAEDHGEWDSFGEAPTSGKPTTQDTGITTTPITHEQSGTSQPAPGAVSASVGVGDGGAGGAAEDGDDWGDNFGVDTDPPAIDSTVSHTKVVNEIAPDGQTTNPDDGKMARAADTEEVLDSKKSNDPASVKMDEIGDGVVEHVEEKAKSPVEAPAEIIASVEAEEPIKENVEPVAEHGSETGVSLSEEVDTFAPVQGEPETPGEHPQSRLDAPEAEKSEKVPDDSSNRLNELEMQDSKKDDLPAIVDTKVVTSESGVEGNKLPPVATSSDTVPGPETSPLEAGHDDPFAEALGDLGVCSTVPKTDKKESEVSAIVDEEEGKEVAVLHNSLPSLEDGQPKDEDKKGDGKSDESRSGLGMSNSPLADTIQPSAEESTLHPKQETGQDEESAVGMTTASDEAAFLSDAAAGEVDEVDIGDLNVLKPTEDVQQVESKEEAVPGTAMSDGGERDVEVLSSEAVDLPSEGPDSTASTTDKGVADDDSKDVENSGEVDVTSQGAADRKDDKELDDDLDDEREKEGEKNLNQEANTKLPGDDWEGFGGEELKSKTADTIDDLEASAVDGKNADAQIRVDDQGSAKKGESGPNVQPPRIEDAEDNGDDGFEDEEPKIDNVEAKEAAPTSGENLDSIEKLEADGDKQEPGEAQERVEAGSDGEKDNNKPRATETVDEWGDIGEETGGEGEEKQGVEEAKDDKGGNEPSGGTNEDEWGSFGNEDMPVSSTGEPKATPVEQDEWGSFPEADDSKNPEKIASAAESNTDGWDTFETNANDSEAKTESEVDPTAEGSKEKPAPADENWGDFDKQGGEGDGGDEEWGNEFGDFQSPEAQAAAAPASATTQPTSSNEILRVWKLPADRRQSAIEKYIGSCVRATESNANLVCDPVLLEKAVNEVASSRLVSTMLEKKGTKPWIVPKSTWHKSVAQRQLHEILKTPLPADPKPKSVFVPLPRPKRSQKADSKENTINILDIDISSPTVRSSEESRPAPSFFDVGGESGTSGSTSFDKIQRDIRTLLLGLPDLKFMLSKVIPAGGTS